MADKTSTKTASRIKLKTKVCLLSYLVKERCNSELPINYVCAEHLSKWLESN